MNKNYQPIQHAPKRFNEATLLHLAETGSEDWAFSRQFGIGGSEVSSILGLNAYKSAYALWCERTGAIEPEPVGNWAVRFGREFEDDILKMWAEDNPEFEVFSTGTYSSNEYPFMQASPDALAKHKETGEWVIIEAKTARYSWYELPPGYRAQVFHYMQVMGLQKAIVIGIVGWDWYEEEVLLDAFESGAQLLAVKNFWDLVQKKIAPDFDGADSTYEAVRKMHPLIDKDLEVEIDGLHHLSLAQGDFDTAKEVLTQSKSEVLGQMGKAKSAYVEVDGERIVVATRQARGTAAPYLVIKKGKK